MTEYVHIYGDESGKSELLSPQVILELRRNSFGLLKKASKMRVTPPQKLSAEQASLIGQTAGMHFDSMQ